MNLNNFRVSSLNIIFRNVEDRIGCSSCQIANLFVMSFLFCDWLLLIILTCFDWLIGMTECRNWIYVWLVCLYWAKSMIDNFCLPGLSGKININSRAAECSLRFCLHCFILPVTSFVIEQSMILACKDFENCRDTLFTISTIIFSVCAYNW